MSLDIGSLVGYIRLDPSGVGKGIDEAQAQIRGGKTSMSKAGDEAGRAAGDAAGKGMSSGLTASLKGLAGVIAAGFVADKVVGFFNDSMSAASDLNETVNKSSAIFGDQSDAMQAWAENAARTMGMSRSAALEAAAGFGDMFSQLGFAGDEAARMSQDVVQMSADLGSFNNLGTEDVAERISAAFRGEYDSLQLLIPNINAARVEQEAMSETGKANAKQLTAQEKAAAVLAIVNKDGARAMGDFAKTADQGANASKTAAAMTEDLKAKVGQQLLPAYITLITYMRDQVLPFLSNVADRTEGIGDAIGPVASGVGDLVSAFSKLPGPVQSSVVAMLAVIALRGRFAAVGEAVGTINQKASGAKSVLGDVRLAMRYAADSADGMAGKTMAATKALGGAGAYGLKSAASGLLGVLGGPWGIAFAAGTMVLAAWMQKHADAKRRVDDLTTAIERDSGAIGKQTRELVVNQLEQDGMLQLAKELGVSLSDVTDAALGNEDAIGRVNRQLEMGRLAHVSYGDGLKEASSDTAAWNDKAEKLRGALKAEAEATDSASASARRKRAAMQSSASATGAATGKTKQNTGAQKENAQATKDAAKAVVDLYNAQLSASSSAIGYQQSIDDATAAIRKNGRTLDLNTQQGRDNRSALDGVASAALRVAQDNLEAGRSAKTVKDRMESARTTFINTAVDMGMTREAARRLADQYGLSKQGVDNLVAAMDKQPGSKNTKLNVDAAQAIADTNAAKGALDQLPANKSITITQYWNSVGGPVLPGAPPPKPWYMGQADGGHVQFFAGGGRWGEPAHEAQYAPAGSWRVFAEGETGGETYIPHAPSKRARSTRLLSQVATEFGYGLHPLGATSGAQIDSRELGREVGAHVERAISRWRPVTSIGGRDMAGAMRSVDRRYGGRLGTGQTHGGVQ